MGFKLPGKSIQTGTSGHSSALKMVTEQRAASALKMQASPAKSPEYDKAAKKDSELGNYVAERKKIKAKYGGDRKKYRASEEYKANQSKINKAYGIDDGYVAPTTTATSEVKEEKQPRVVKTSSTIKDKSVYRKDGTLKKEVTKSVDEDSDGRRVEKDKKVYRKNGNLKKDVKVHTSKDDNPATYSKTQKDKYKTTFRKDGSKKKETTIRRHGDVNAKTVKKYNKDGVLVKKKHKRKEKDLNDGDGVIRVRSKHTKHGKKEVTRGGGRRTVTKTDPEGNVTTKSRRTLKGILTGKGKKKKEETE